MDTIPPPGPDIPLAADGNALAPARLEAQIGAAMLAQPHLSSLVGGLTRQLKIRLPIALVEEARRKAGDIRDDELLIQLALLHLVSRGE